ncbi:hypothetical protein C8Q78DRAFT_564004 [Trametes maxima]|nr:hypothetical protein C8Q78DRAFT_564004 [Trametes maxima]
MAPYFEPLPDFPVGGDEELGIVSSQPAVDVDYLLPANTMSDDEAFGMLGYEKGDDDDDDDDDDNDDDDDGSDDDEDDRMTDEFAINGVRLGTTEANAPQVLLPSTLAARAQWQAPERLNLFPELGDITLWDTDPIADPCWIPSVDHYHMVAIWDHEPDTVQLRPCLAVGSSLPEDIQDADDEAEVLHILGVTPIFCDRVGAVISDSGFSSGTEQD